MPWKNPVIPAKSKLPYGVNPDDYGGRTARQYCISARFFFFGQLPCSFQN